MLGDRSARPSGWQAQTPVWHNHRPHVRSRLCDNGSAAEWAPLDEAAVGWRVTAAAISGEALACEPVEWIFSEQPLCGTHCYCIGGVGWAGGYCQGRGLGMLESLSGSVVDLYAESLHLSALWR